MSEFFWVFLHSPENKTAHTHESNTEMTNSCLVIFIWTHIILIKPEILGTDEIVYSKNLGLTDL